MNMDELPRIDWIGLALLAALAAWAWSTGGGAGPADYCRTDSPGSIAVILNCPKPQ